MPQQAALRDVSDAWSAFEGEVLPHADRLFRLAMWFVRNRSDAEDVVQETMIQALESFHRFQPWNNCLAWLTTILQRIVSNHRSAAVRSIDSPATATPVPCPHGDRWAAPAPRGSARGVRPCPRAATFRAVPEPPARPVARRLGPRCPSLVSLAMAIGDHQKLQIDVSPNDVNEYSPRSTVMVDRRLFDRLPNPQSRRLPVNRSRNRNRLMKSR